MATKAEGPEATEMAFSAAAWITGSMVVTSGSPGTPSKTWITSGTLSGPISCTWPDGSPESTSLYRAWSPWVPMVSPASTNGPSAAACSAVAGPVVPTIRGAVSGASGRPLRSTMAARVGAVRVRAKRSPSTMPG